MVNLVTEAWNACFASVALEYCCRTLLEINFYKIIKTGTNKFYPHHRPKLHTKNRYKTKEINTIKQSGSAINNDNISWSDDKTLNRID